MFDKNPSYKILAGGTDLCVLMNSKLIKPEGLISISNIAEMKKISDDGEFIDIGALATHAQIFEDKLVKKHLPVLVEACKTVGARQIQNRGTIGGNVMNASPAGDTLPVLLAYETQVEVAGMRGRRSIDFGEFYKGYRKTALAKGEIVTNIRIKRSVKGERSAFLKVGTRKAQAISKVMGCYRNYDQNHIIAFGSVAATPVRLKECEEFLSGKKITKEIIAEASEIAMKEVKPIGDIRSTADYRRHVVGVLVKRFLETV